ncbi:MAG: hypothetical protein K0S32_845 [Bacteroidetes bacterium]|jgi:hypothetical protein|nr:hypothetical protein [Bacteroidota bacterium]
MIKKLLLLAFAGFLTKTTYSQSFSLYYSFSAVAGGTASTGPVDPTPAPTGAGVTSGSWTAVGTGTVPSGGGYFSFTGWGTGATNGSNTTFTGSIDPGKYYELTLSPQLNYMVTLTNMSFGTSRSGTGVRHWSVRTNKDSYTANVPATYTALNAAASATSPVISVIANDVFQWNDDALNTGTGATAFATNNICNVNFSGANYTNQAGPYTFRVYAWDAEGSGGTFRMDTLVLNGTSTFSLGVGLPTLSHDLNAKFKLYPNPSANGLVTVEANGNFSKVEVVNILGSVVASQNAILNEKINLDLTTLPTGTYFVRMTSGAKVTTEKLIISK